MNYGFFCICNLRTTSSVIQIMWVWNEMVGIRVFFILFLHFYLYIFNFNFFLVVQFWQGYWADLVSRVLQTHWRFFFLLISYSGSIFTVLSELYGCNWGGENCGAVVLRGWANQTLRGVISFFGTSFPQILSLVVVK